MSARGTTKTTACDVGTAERHLAKARGFLQDAQTAAADDSKAVLFVMAGIHASDAICCAALRKHATGSNHHAATELLMEIGPNGREHADDLATLIRDKNRVSYTIEPLRLSELKKCQRAAEALIDAADNAIATARGKTC